MSESKERKMQYTMRLEALLARSRELRARQITADGLTPGQRLLARWQSERLALTYADLRALERYAPAVEFFLSDLYGPRDFSQRDETVERVYPLMVRVLSEHALESIALAVELHALSQALDSRMVEILTGELGMHDRLEAPMYAEAYRRCGDFAGRERQIELVDRVGRVLDEVVKNPMIYTTVRLARKPARMAGFGDLQAFVEHGLHAFRRMQGAGEFLEAIRTRETQISRQVREGAAPQVWLGAPALTVTLDTL